MEVGVGVALGGIDGLGVGVLLGVAVGKKTIVEVPEGLMVVVKSNGIGVGAGKICGTGEAGT